MTQTTNHYIQTGEVTSTNVPWYDAPLQPPLPPHIQALFETYVGLSPSEAASRIESIVRLPLPLSSSIPYLPLLFFILNLNLLHPRPLPRQRSKAWRITPYPCIGQHTFLFTPITHRPHLYTEILSRMKNDNALFLDIGAGMAQELRRFVADGAPSGNMVAVDVGTDFWELGYELFGDRGRLGARFLRVDVLNEDEDGDVDDEDEGRKELDALKGRVDILHAGSFFHLFDWSAQMCALRRLIALAASNALFVGHQTGREPAKETDIGGKPRFYHDEESWRKLWREAEEATDTQWEVETVFGGYEVLGLKGDFAWQGPFAAFSARRIR
ncbi:MAG: hypothetical protein MMC33_006026 [Icmadophila ericetorum]|nr:hypothetical protein [Icmadophila ericetorum]